MNQLIQESTKKLLNHSDRLCVSLYLRASDINVCRKDFINLWDEAYSRAEDQFPSALVERVFSKLKLEEVLERVNPEYDMLCIFASTKGAFYVYLDNAIRPQAIIDKSFYVKPLAYTLSSSDQCWLLEVRPEKLSLSIVSLSGLLRFAELSIESRSFGRSRDSLKFLIRTINRDRRPWLIAGPMEQVLAARNLLSRSGLRRPPAAHILHSSVERIEEGAREVIRMKARALEENFASKLKKYKEESRPLILHQELIRSSLERGEIETLLVDDREPRSNSNLYLKLLGRDEIEEDELILDDLVERAIARNCRVILTRNLESIAGSSAVGLVNSSSRLYS